jgi:glutamate-1-semialdehyde 2,1-aminomutase
MSINASATVLGIDDALAELRATYRSANPESERRFTDALAVMPGANTRSTIHFDPFPLTIVSGAGQHLTDADGHEYVDFLSEYTAAIYGHSHPVIMRAAEEAMRRGMVRGGPNEYEARLAAAVAKRLPSCERVRFCNSGTEANLIALTTARAHTGRSRVVAFDGSYHGSLWSLRDPTSPFRAPFPLIRGRYNDLDETSRRLDPAVADIAAIIVEPVVGAGAIPGDRAFLHGLRNYATAHGIILIFDEVMTSRLSPTGMQGRLGIAPDMTTFGKYIGGGFTIGGFGGREEIMRHFDPREPGAFDHGGTFNQNVVSMAAGAAGLTEVLTPEATDALNHAGDRLRDRLNGTLRERGVDAQVTGIGSILCFHFRAAPIARIDDVARLPSAYKDVLHLALVQEGFYIAPRGLMSLNVALTGDDHDRFLGAVDRVLDRYAPGLPRRA